MINIVKKLPKKLYVAFSGGVDSVVMTHLARDKGIDVTLAFFDHGDEYASVETSFVQQYAKNNNFNLVTERCNEQMTGSKESFWRVSRYNWFKTLDGLVATGHQLDDAVEWYLMTCLRGEGHYMPYSHSNVVRPLLKTRKTEIVKYAEQNKLSWLEDLSNQDVNFTVRNKVRHQLLPIAEEMSPGLFGIVKNKIHKKTFNVA